jgi:FkbM family methyltransferase
MRAMIQRFFNLLGLNVGLTGGGLLAGFKKLRAPEVSAYTWVRSMGIKTVVDVGAHQGEAALEFRALLPQAVIYSFEPLPDNFRKLEMNLKGRENFRMFNLAVGERKGRIRMYQSAYSPSSSVLKMGNLHKTLFPSSAGQTEVDVEMTTLDEAAASLNLGDNILLKIDVQGYEMNVLAGSAGVLKRTSVLIVETSFKTMYEGQSLFADVNSFLEARGFVYAGNWSELKSPADGIPLQQDSIFIRKNHGA